MAKIVLQTFAAFSLLGTICKTPVDAVGPETCRLPILSGNEYSAFTGKITALFRQSNGRTTALVHVLNVYRRDAQLKSSAIINAIDQALLCGRHQHRRGDTRLWITKRHSSGMLTGITSLPVTMELIDQVLEAIPDDSLDSRPKSAFQQGRLPCNESNCQYGGQCSLDSTGLLRCQCSIYCARQTDPVCGTDGVTYKNPCQLRRTSCQNQRNITQLHYGYCGATSCAGLKNAGIASSDGEYLIYVRSECDTPIKVYCHGMNTSSPKEFITLPSGVQNNYAYIYAKRLPHRPYSARFRCAGKPGKFRYSEAGLTKFRRVRVNLTSMAIDRKDFTFAKSDPIVNNIPYGSAGDCFSMHYGEACRRGQFKVDLALTGLRLRPSVQWKAVGFPPGIEMSEYKKSKDGTFVSSKCGGWCGKCRPAGEMFLEQTVCRQDEDPCQSIVCEFYSICRRSNEGRGHVCECPTNCSKVNSPVCGSDGNTYENECQLQRYSCVNRVAITARTMTACGLKEPVHLMFAIDIPSMAQPEIVAKSRRFFKDVGNKFKIPTQGITYGFLKFDLSGKAKMDFVKFVNYIALPAYVNTLRSADNTTTLDLAMRDSVQGILNSFEFDSRLKDSQHPKAIVLITDGSSVTSRQELAVISRALKEAGIKVIVVLVGDAEMGLENVMSLASGDKYLQVVGSPDRLKIKVQETVDKILLDFDSCEWKRCNFYSKCVKRDVVTCQCSPLTNTENNPVCGSDGKSYKNLDALEAAACKGQKWIVPRHYGSCITDPSCDSLNCKYYAYCTVPSSGIATCTCPDVAACGNSSNRVCGTDDLTYDHVCHLTSDACKRYHEVRVLHAGLCIQKPIDLVFAFGGAARISRDTFQKQKNFIKQFLDAYTASSPGIHVAFINYGSGEILTEFSNYDTDNLKDKVDKMRFSAGGTVEGALTRAQRVTFGDPELLRSYAIKALIVLTGDTVDDSNNKLRDASLPLIRKGIKIVTVAVGKIPEKRKWVSFSSGEEYVFDFSSNGDLPSLVPKVYEVIIKDPCEKKVCEHYSQCVSYDDGRTECACVDQCAQVDDPVCGSDGLDYSNECVLKATACRESRELGVTDERPCGACAHAMDVAVLVDSSRTVGWSNFETLKRSLAKFTDYFHVSNEGTHFGFIHFKQGPVVDFDFGNSSFHNADSLKQKIMGITYDPGLSRMDQAMALANAKLFTDRGGMRKGVPKFLIVFTDGKYDEGSASYAGVLDSLKSKGVQVLVVGVGRRAGNSKLQNIAMGNPQNVMMLTSFDQLAVNFRNLTKTVCQAIEPLNLIFAINANGPKARDNFARMTKTITSVVDSYGQKNVSYGLIVYGDTAVSRIQLTEEFQNDAQLKSYVKMVQRGGDGADLTSALENARDLFVGELDKRRNVLVVITDSASTGDKEGLRRIADDLHEMRVKVISVAMGNESDPSELRRLSPKKDNSLRDKANESPKQLADRIMKEAIKPFEYVTLVDIGFALSAYSAYAPENFKKMKEFIHSIVDQYSIGRVKYGLVVYGADAEVSFDFQREFPKDEDLHRSIEILRPVKGGSNLEEGLKRDQELFTANGTRRNARKVLVVFTDSKSTGDSKRTEAIAKKLKDDNIKVIAVGLGSQSDLNELDDVATDRRHVIPAKRADNTEKLTKDVMALAFEEIPDVPMVDVAFALSATSSDASETFKLMKDTVASFADMYGMSKINYALITYGRASKIWFDLQSQPSDFDALVKMLNRTLRETGVVALDKAIEKARKLFDGSRPPARKVLVVITDNKSGSRVDNVRKAARPLEDDGIAVIPVAIGDDADAKELENLAPDVLQPPDGIKPDELAKLIMKEIYTVQPPIQQIDLGFALSAASVFQNETFKLMKDTISYIIETYGTEKIHYSVLVFGNTATTKITFGQTPPSPEQLKSAIQRISFGTGRADLAKALEKALKLFEDAAGSRPLTHKVLVIMADLKSGSSEEDVKAAAKPLDEKDITVIAVAVEKDADPRELEFTTPDKKKVIKAAKDNKPSEVGEKIMDKIREKPPVPEIDLAFAVSATATDADETFNRIKDTAKYIVKKHGTEQIHYAFLVFGLFPSRKRDFSRDMISKEEMINFLNSVPRSSTGADLEKALTESSKLFKAPGARPGAKKVLVVIVDKRSGVSESSIKAAANTLHASNVKVIPVAVGNESDSKEAETVTEDKNNLIEAPKNFESNNLAETVMRKVLKVPYAPDVDVIFAVGATSDEAAETLRTMKDTMIYVINTYGVGNIRYGIISFGEDPTILLRFTEKEPSPERLKQLMQGLPGSQGPPDFEEVLKAAKNVFDGEDLRPNALKVVVVVTDDRSRSTAEEIRSAATQLEEKAIHVIVVGIGKTPDVTQLEKMTQKSGDVIKAPKDAEPGQLGEKIMEKAFQPVLLPIEETDLVIAMCYASTLSDQTFDLMKDTVKSIVDKYGTSQVHYAVVIYGTKATTMARFSDMIGLTKDAVKETIDSFPKLRASRTSPVLDQALESAKSLFEGDDVRQSAKKVLLILTDRSSGLEESALRTGASNLESNDIEIIAVSIGIESDVTELAYVTPHTGNIIDAPTDKDPDKLSSEIVKLIRTDPPPVKAEIDVVFAISADSVNYAQTFSLMRDSISWIIGEYGTSKLSYSVIVFGVDASTEINFDRDVPTPNVLIESVRQLLRKTGGSDLKKAMEEAASVFEGAAARPGARKVLVVITDKGSGLSSSDIEKAAEPLHNRGVKVIPVAVGAEASPSELISTNPAHQFVIKAPRNEDPQRLGQQIMENVVRPTFSPIDVVFALSATGTSAKVTFQLMKDTIDLIAGKYGMGNMRYSLILFSDKANINIRFSEKYASLNDLMSAIQALPAVTGNPNLPAALTAAKEAFEDSGVRKDSTHVLVVFTDKRSGAAEDNVTTAARPLEDSAIVVIPVAIGNEVDNDELEWATSDKDNVVDVGTDEEPENLMEMILAKINGTQRKPAVDLAFALSATSLQSSRAFQLMKDVIVDVIEDYGTKDIRYCLILFGADASTKFSFTSDPVNPRDLKTFVNFLPQIKPPSSPHAALEEASRAFRGRGVRVNASKVLVVMTDSNGDSAEQELEAVFKPLKQLNVKVIALGLGTAVDAAEIVKIPRDKDAVILAPLGEDSKDLSETLMKEVFKPAPPKVPEVDLVFAISATSSSAAEVFKKTKEAISYIINTYGTNSIHFAVIFFGSDVAPIIDFQSYATSQQLKNLLENQTRLLGGPALDEALKKAKEVFESPGARRDARKVLVVITDQDSASSFPGAVKPELDALEDMEVGLIAVGIGDEVDEKELLEMTPNISDVIRILEVDDPEELGKDIVLKVLKERPKVPEIDLVFAIAATNVIFPRMRDAVKIISETYGLNKLYYSVIVFGSSPSLIFDFTTKFPSRESLAYFIDRLESVSWGPDTKAALEKAVEVIESSGTRPTAKTVLVLITDGASPSNPREVTRSIEAIEREGTPVLEFNVTSRDEPGKLAENVMEKVFAAVLEPPEIDLCFALSATAVDADNIFQLMKDTLIDLIDNYGIGKIRYSVISFGSQANLLLGLDSGISDPIELKQLIGSYTRASGDAPALDKALEMALETFKHGVTRPNARKVLVVIVDNGSGLEEGEIALKAKQLAEKGIRVIAVAVGADEQELEVVASDKRDVLSVPTSIKPSNLSKEIFVLVVTDRPLDVPKLDLVFAVSATGQDADEAFKLMRDTISSLLQRYDSSNIRYGLLIYGSDAITVSHLQNHTDVDKIKEELTTVKASVGPSAVNVALEAAEKMFSTAEERRDADRVLVILTDKNSMADKDVVLDATQPLEKMAVKIIVVAVSNEVNPDGFKDVTNKENIIETQIDKEPEDLSYEVMERVINGTLRLPATNIVFAVSATGREANETHAFIKEILKSVISTYGTNRLETSVIVYGEFASTEIMFGDIFQTDAALIKAVLDTPTISGVPSLEKALEEAKKQFESPFIRPKAAKVLVVITDRSSNKSPEDIRSALVPLETGGVVVIAVAVGKEVDSDKVKKIPTDGDVIDTDNKEDPDEVGEEIIKKIAKGKPPVPELDLGFAIAASSLEADKAFQLMKDTIAEIVKAYKLDKINYGLIVFGDAASIKIQSGGFTKVNDLLRYLAVIPKQTRGAALDEMLKEAERLFAASGSRPHARKVLVVITDLASGLSSSQLIDAAKTWQDKDVKIVAVAIGEQADTKELEALTAKQNIIEEPVTVRPNELKSTIMEKVLKETSSFPAMDLVFAVSANSGDAATSFELMKDSVRKIMYDLGYADGNVQYGIIAYGSPVVQLRESSFDTIQGFRAYVQNLPKQSRDPQLHKTSQEALKMFKGPGARAGAKQVLVVLIDKKSTSSSTEIKAASKLLDEERVRVIPVAIGDEADPKELVQVTPFRGDLIEAKEDEEPWRLARQIIIKALIEPARIAKLDVAFAVSASSSDASDTLQHFKDIIKAISDTYGTDKIHYGLISYGDSAVIKLPFSSRNSSLERLKNLIDSLTVETGGSDLEEALDAAVMILKEQGVRFDAQKVLVLMTDAKSTGDDVQSDKTAKDLKNDGVNIITVPIAGETDHGIFKNISSSLNNVVNTTTKENPETVAEKVIERTDPLKGTSIDVGFAISASSPDSSEILRLLKDTIKFIIDTYGTTNLRYSLMTFADSPTVLTHFSESQTLEDLKNRLGSATSGSGQPDMTRMLVQAERLFTTSGSRPNAKKFLVVFIDNKSANDEDALIEGARSLVDSGFWVIPVAVGDNANVKELELLSPLKETTIVVPKTGDPDNLGGEIIDGMKKLVGEQAVPEFDLGFIISAGSSAADSNMQQVKNVIKSFIAKYAMHRLQYGIISSGSTPKIKLKIAESSKPDVMQRVNAIGLPEGAPDLSRAMELGKNLLMPGRLNAEKVLVIITDVKSGSSLIKVKVTTESLDKEDIRVFGVSLGNEGDSAELETATGSKKNVINASSTDNPGRIREEIMDKIRQAKPPQVVDVVFAISATARDAEKTFSFMKEVIKSIFEKYGVDSLRPAVIVFGDTVSVRMNFQDSLEQDALKRLVQGLTPNRGTPDLEKALAEAKTMFSGARPHAKKVLVIISDDRSDSKSWKVKQSSQELEEDEVDVIPVGVGNEVDIQQLKDTTPQKKNAILANNDDAVGDLADKIVDIMRERRIAVPKVDLMFVVNAQASDSLYYMKDVIIDVMQNYSTNLIHYAVVMYGDEPSVVLRFSDGVTDSDQLAGIVRSAPSVPGDSALDKALQKASYLFNEDEVVRPDARKILVVITDDKSSRDKEAAKGIANDLKDKLVTIITVAVGSDADRKELEGLTETESDSLNATKDESPGETGKEIIETIVKADPLEREDIDMVFTVSASSSKAEETLMLMKQTLQYIVARQGVGNIYYSVISFGAQTQKVVDFQDKFPDDDALISQLERLPAVTGTPDLDSALAEARRVFQGPGARVGAKRILVVMVDNWSGSTEEDILRVAKILEDEDVKVIPVAIGSAVERGELEKTTPYKDNIVDAPEKENPESLGKKIMRKAGENLNLPTVPEVDLVFAISAASVKAEETFEKAKAVIKEIVDSYAMDKLRYGVVVFGSTASIKITFDDYFYDDENLKAAVDVLSGSKERPALDEALKKAKELFDNSIGRSNARKILVIITDIKSTSALVDSGKIGKLLEEDGVSVVAVGIGDQVDHKELEAIVPDKSCVVNVTDEVDLEDLKNRIMNKVTGDAKGEELDVVMAISVGAQNIQSFKKISLEFLEKHPISEADYSFLTYNSGVKTMSTFQTKFFSNSQVKDVIESITSRSGSSSRLDLALEEAKKLFARGSGSRPQGKKIVVIYTDKEPTGDARGAAAERVGKEMEDGGIQIVVVLLNMTSVPETYEDVTPNRESVIPTHSEENPKKVVDKIDNVLKAGLQLTPEIELGFAFSSTSSDSSAISKLMRDTIAAIIDKYGSVKLHYLAVVFGNQAQTVINVTNQDQDPKTLISYINSTSQPVGSPRLQVALREAKKAFDEVPMRPGVKRVFVVLIDNKSAGDEDDLQKIAASKELYAAGVTIIPVAIDGEADSSELEKITVYKENLIEESKDVSPGELAEKIMEKSLGVLEEKIVPETDIVFAIAASSESDWLENLKQIKETIHSVLETYSMDVIRVGVILFGKYTKAIDIQQTLSKDLQMPVNKLFPKFGDLDLDNALKESRRLFKNTGRPNARKVLVVISDKASGSTYNDVKIEADLLKEEDIVLISVVIGQEADTKELIDFTPFNVTKTTTEEDPKELAKKIIVLVLTDPQVPELDLGFAVSVTPGVAQQHLKLVRETIQELIDRYGVGRSVHYGLMVFDTSAVIKIPFTSQVTDSTVLKKSVDDKLTSTSRSPNLGAALEGAEKLFNGSNRSQAKKILIVIMDQKSVSEPSSVEKKVRLLVYQGVTSIPVIVGSDIILKSR